MPPVLPWYNTHREYESNLSEARIQAGLTISELCKKIDIHIQAYTRLNSGLLPPISPKGKVHPAALRLSEYFGMNLSDLWPMYFCDIKTHLNVTDEQIIENFHLGLLDDDFDDPEKIFIRKERWSLIREIFGRLSKRDIDILNMFFCEEMNFSQIAQRVGLSSNTIAIYFRNAIRRLKYCKRRPRVKELFSDYLQTNN